VNSPLKLLLTVGGVLYIAISSLDCVSTGAIDPQGYRHTDFGYAVRSLEPGSAQFLPPHWQLDNFQIDRVSGQWEQKTGGHWKAVRRVDLNGDGVIDKSETNEEPAYDLHFVHEVNGGIIWVKAHPVRKDRGRLALDVVLDDYIDSLRGTGLFEQGDLFGLETVVARKFTTFVPERKSTKVAGRPAVEAVIALAETDRLEIDKSERSGIVRVVMIRFPFYVKASVTGPNESQVFDGKDGHRYVKRNALLVIGYYNTPRYFKENVGDLDGLLTRVTLPSGSPP
jgi:hypothetical protein